MTRQPDGWGRGWSPDILFSTAAADISYLHVGHNFNSNDQIKPPPPLPRTRTGVRTIFIADYENTTNNNIVVVHYFLSRVYRIPFCIVPTYVFLAQRTAY